MRTLLTLAVAVFATLHMFPTVAGAQTVPELPCCIDFDDPTTPGYTISGSAVKELEIRQPGPSGDPNDGYLHAKDGSGASWARLKPQLDGSLNCFGDWKSLIKPGKCIELCWDVNLLTDGVGDVIAKPAHITIWSGGLRATFRTSTNIDENGGWYSFCAPIALANSDGTLPSNDQGEWIMNDTNGDPVAPNVWNDLLCNIDQIAFFVDYHSSISEEWCWDNVCLKEGDCDDCMEVANGKWDCVVDPATGERTLTYNFDVTNNSSQVAQVGLTPTPVGFTVEPNTFDFDPDLAPGDTGNVTLTIAGAKAGTEICFDFVLFNYQEGECCREEICVKVPCVKIENEAVVCNSALGADYTFDITNISGGPIEWAYLVSDDPGVVFTPPMVNLGGLADGATTNVGPIHINGATAGEELCFYIVLLDAEMMECCIQRQCVTMPEECTFTVAETDGNGKQVHPCEPNTPMSSLSPDGCILVCDESIECDPEDPNCVFYSFTVTNLGSSAMSHILFPNPDITPGSVVFPDPLDPGEAARVTVKICNVTEGPFTVPMVTVSVDDCTCCHFMHEIQIPKCDCLRVAEEKLECEGIDPLNPGFYCYTYCATITNLTGEPVEHIFLFPQTGSNVTFDPDHFPVGGLPHLGTYTLVTTVKIPVGATDIHFHISLHNQEFVECCAVERWMRVPDCCDCEETLRFEFGATGPFDAPLPEGVSLLNLVRNPNTGKIGFSPDGSVDPFPFVYMAASSLGTIVRIDANTGVVLGEFWTAPQTRSFTNPSRTTVDKFGECWLGNRNDFLAPTNKGSVIRIGLITGGTRGDRLGPIGGPYTFAANPAGEYLQGPFTYVSPSVVDRDGDGFIRTSSGLGNVLDWDAALTTGNDAGGITLADDECIVNFVRVPEPGPRALAIDSNNDLWVGGLSTTIYQQVLGTTGALGVMHNVPGGYGALIDGNDVLWSVDSGSGVQRHDLAANTTTFSPVPGAYGIGINPCDGHIWVGGWPDLHRIDPSGAAAGNWTPPGFAQGISVDRNGHVWMSGNMLYRFDGVGTWLPSVAVSSTGNAVDHNGKIWVSNIGGSSADRVDPAPVAFVDNVTPLSAGSFPYNYSDMTGFVTLGASGQTGIMLFTHDSLCPGTDWGRVTWATQGEEGDDCRIAAEVRASDDPLNFPTAWTPVTSGVSFCGAPAGGTGIAGQYVQVRLTFTRPGGCPPECNPELCWLKVECCDVFDVGPGNTDPTVEISPPVVVANPTVLFDPISAHVNDVDGDKLTATWIVDSQVISTSPVDEGGTTTLEHTFGDGVSQVELRVSDGKVVVSAETTVMIGDHLAPEIRCDSPEFANGDRRLSTFEALIPDVVSLSSVTDNVTPSSEMQIIQNPPPGTVVQQGTHQILLTATDGAGNVGHCSVYLLVQQVVNVTGISNYQRFDVGETITIGASWQVPVSEVAETVILVNGEVFRTYQGAMSGTVDLDLPAGEYRIVYVVTSTTGAVSAVNARSVRVGTSAQGFGVEVELLITHVDADNVSVSFVAPQGVEWQLQHSDSLESDTWVTIQTVIGAGETIEHEIDLTSSDTKAFYRVLYILP